jgi:hypothetical protein
MLSAFADLMISATLSQITAGSYVKGIWTPGTPSNSTISIIAPQPVTPEEKQMLPTGELDRNYLQTWTETEIESWGVSNDPDKLTIGSKTYKIHSIEDRSTLGNFYEIVIYEEKSNE